MSERRIAIAVALTVVALLVASCDGGGGDTVPSTTSTTPTTRKPATHKTTLPEWAQRVCVGMGAWDDALQRLGSEAVTPATGTDATSARAALGKALAQAATATDALLATLNDVGDAPTSGGAEASAQLRAAFTTARDALTVAGEAAKRLPVESVEAYEASRVTFASNTGMAITAARATFDNALDLPALDAAFAAAPACALTA
jgi:hypothetical protein